MKEHNSYFMENEEESIRLDVKTDPATVRDQAAWCGLKPGMRVLDVGCGSGKAASILHAMVMPGGQVTGVDFSEARLAYAREHFGGKEGVEFLHRDISKPMEGLGTFDIVWVRFILEYFRRESPAIVRNLGSLVKPGGHLCLIDLDCNCLNHHELPEPMARTLQNLAGALDRDHNFDSFVGRKLYSYLYDEGYNHIAVDLRAHHLIYGEAREADIFNWLKKIEVAARRMTGLFEDYPGGPQGFREDFRTFFLDPRRFTYTPLIMVKGMRPLRQ